MDFHDIIDKTNDYEVYRYAKYGTLPLYPLKELVMPEYLLALLESIVNHYNELSEDEELETFPNSQLISWFEKTINKSKSWCNLETPLRLKLLDICWDE